jgi:hypothetical protein
MTSDQPADETSPHAAEQATCRPPAEPGPAGGRPTSIPARKRLRPVPRPRGKGTPRTPRGDTPAPAVTLRDRAAPHPAVPAPANLQPAWNGGQICGLFGIDIAGFTHPSRDEHVQLYLREMIYRILERAFDGSGVPWHACHHEDRGDGVLIIVPPAITADGLADPLPERLCGLVRVHNRLSAQDARIQLRAAAHIGTVYRDDHGFAGDAVSHLCRLLDTPRLKHLLKATSSELAFITSDYFYTTVIRRHPTLVDPAAFRQVTVDLKHAQATGWVQLLRAAQPPFGQSA